jgi:hypothetical protein
VPRKETLTVNQWVNLVELLTGKASQLLEAEANAVWEFSDKIDAAVNYHGFEDEVEIEINDDEAKVFDELRPQLKG